MRILFMKTPGLAAGGFPPSPLIDELKFLPLTSLRPPVWPELDRSLDWGGTNMDFTKVRRIDALLSKIYAKPDQARLPLVSRGNSS